MDKFLEDLSSHCGWDCVLKSYDGWRVCLASGTSPEYATPLVAFCGVSYLACPTEFSHANFRLANEAERKSMGKLVPLGVEDYVVAIEAETMAGLERQIFFVVAQSCELLAKAQLNISSDA
jgi:hypothetical protein